jgi:hypothetical protein
VRPLNTAEADADDSPTDEHIFPQSILGVVTMRDCCKHCNSRLGCAVDKLLLADERIVLAAREAGINEGELLSRFSGMGFDSLNRPARYTVRGAEWRLEPDFQRQGFKIGMIGGKILHKDLQNAKGKMRRLVAADKTLQLSTLEVANAVDELFDAFLAKSGAEAVYSQKIRQGIRAGRGPTHIRLGGIYDPHGTERAIAKIAYETSVALLPLELFSKVRSVLDQLKGFVDHGAGPESMFSHGAAAAAGRWHAANVIVIGDSLQITVTLFGKETWTGGFNVLANAKPAPLDGFEVTLRSEFPFGGPKAGKVF